MASSRITQGPLSVCETRLAIVFPRPSLKFRTAGFPQYGFKREVRRDLRRGRPGLYVTPVCLWETCGPCGQEIGSPSHTLSSRGPWLADRLYCPARSLLTMASSEPLVANPRLIFFVRGSLRRRVGPQFKLSVCSCMPPPVPRWIGQVHSTVASLSASVFAKSAVARHPRWSTHVGSRVVV